MMRALSLASLALLLALSTLPAVSQTVSPAPPLMNFQGRLSKPDGTPLPDGVYLLTLSLWDAMSGGNRKWQGLLLPTPVHNGVFGVLIDRLTDSVFQNDLWLEIKVGTDAPLSPRQRLVSVAYAFKANSVADGSIGTNQLANGAITADKFASNLLNPLAWLLGGNAGTNPATHFLGTTDSQSLVFRTNNSERIRLSEDGFVGIGTATPQQYLSVQGGLNIDQGNLNDGLIFADHTEPALRFGSQSGEAIASKRTEGGNRYGLDFYTAGHNRMSITVDGKVGIGTTAPAVPLHVISTVYPNTILESAFGAGTWLSLRNTATGGHNWSLISSGPNNIEGAGKLMFHDFSAGTRMVIDTAGNVGIGDVTPSYRLDVAGDINASGKVRAAGVALSSDARYKMNVQTFENALETILKLRGVTFDWDRERWKGLDFEAGRQIGFIAQEVEKVLPELVSTDSKGYKSVAYQNVVPVLVEAVKAQQKQMGTLQKANDAICSENTALKAKIREIDTLKAQLAALTERMAQREATKSVRK